MSGYIGTAPVPQAVQRRENFTATAAQVTFPVAGYTVGFVDVFLNGVHLLGDGTDYTASNGSDIVLTAGASAGDVVEVISFETFEVANQTFTGTTTVDVLTAAGAFTSVGIDDNATSTAITIDASENVIIASTGGTLQTATAGTSNFRAGVNAGNSIASGGNYNTVVGDEAGTAITTGDNNTAVGYDSLGANTTASNNTAIGYQALYDNTTAERNTAVGRIAAANTTTGADNTVMGSAALTTNTTGASNVAIGASALRLNTTSNLNTAVGYEAGYNTTGENNTFVGRYAGSNITTGNRNTVIGGFDGNYGGLDIRTSTNNIVLSDGDGNPRVVVGASGNVLVNATSGSSTDTMTISRKSGSAIKTTTGTSGNVNHIIFQNSNGAVGSIRTNGSATSYSVSSDYRLKENVTPIQGAADIVKAMRPCTYNFKADTNDWHDGFLAHELQEVHPRAVSGTKDAMLDEEYEVTPAVYEDVVTPAVDAVAATYDDEGLELTPAVEAAPETTENTLVAEAVTGTRSVPDMQGVDYSKLTPILTAALQEALTKIEALEVRLTALEATP